MSDDLTADLRWPRVTRDERPAPLLDDHEARPSDVPLDREPKGPERLDEAPVEVVGGVVERPRFDRATIEAYDRLAERLLERLRSLREDLDADLAEVRSEIASLRAAVDDVGDRVQLRQLRASINELRGDVSSMRRAVTEWPELEQVSHDISSLRADMATLCETGGTSGPVDVAPVLEATAAVQAELVSLRRRIALRASGESSLSDEQLDLLAEAVTTRLLRRMRAREG
jgi:hypothetical protein